MINESKIELMIRMVLLLVGLVLLHGFIGLCPCLVSSLVVALGLWHANLLK